MIKVPNGKEDLDIQCVFLWLGFLLMSITVQKKRRRVEGNENLTQLTTTIVIKTTVFHYAIFYTWNSRLICPLSYY